MSLEDVKDSVRTNTSGVVSFARCQFDRILPPATRQQAYDSTASFAQEHPVLSCFLLTQGLFCFFPLLVFAAFSLFTVAFALGAALVFALFWISVAFMTLVPTLLVAASVGLMVFGWGLSSFLVGRWVYSHSPLGRGRDDAVVAHRRPTNGVPEEDDSYAKREADGI